MSALPVPVLEPFDDIEDGIREVIAAELHGARKRQAFGDKLRLAIETTRLLRDRACANGSEAMAELASMERDRVDDVFDQRPSQVRIAEQTMRSV